MSDEAEITTRVHILKADMHRLLETASNARPLDELASRFSNAGALEPPYKPEYLCALHDMSSTLRPNVDAYSVNIEGFGHRLVPRIDLSHSNAKESVRDAILVERLFDGQFEMPNEEEIKQALEIIGAEMRIEKLRLNAFFENACADMSFVYLRKITRADMEITGNAYWEILRDSHGRICQFSFIPSHTMRLMPIDADLTETIVMRRISDIGLRPMKVRKRFRRYVQVISGLNTVFFKELDDPRIMSASTGRYYSSLADLQMAEPKAAPATEVLHFKVYSAQSAYGVPRWMGATLAVIGTRTSEEVNIAYFDNKAVPPMALLVSGGRLSNGTIERIEGYIRDHLQGKKNFHSILVIEGEAMNSALGAAGGSNVKLDFKSLSDAQQKDAMFQEYESANAEKVGAQFRLPRIIRGNMSDFNRSTGDAALAYAEQQVFQPERNDMDYVIDQRILASLGVRYHEFVSNAPDLRDPIALSNAIAQLCDVGVLTPTEARRFIGDIFNVELQQIDEPWTRLPMKLLLGGIAPPSMGDEADDQAGKPNIQLAPTDAAQVITVNEARAALGLPKLMVGENESPDGQKTLAEFTAGHAGKAPIQELANMQKALEKVSHVARVKLLEDARKQAAVAKDMDEREGVA